MREPTPDEASRPAEGPSGVRSQGSFGAWLRHQREARSVSLREIADSSKISMRYLDALEQDRFDVLPAPVFARGFLREYARVVGLNPDEVVNLYLVALEETKGATARVETQRAPRSKAGPSPVGYGLLLALAVLLFLGIAALLSFYAERRKAPAAPPPAAIQESSGSVGREELPSGDEDHSSPVEAEATAAAEPDVAGGATAVSSVAPAAAAPAEPEPLRLILTFVQDCWLETVVDGRHRESELRAAGETVALEAKDSVVLTLGNASAVAVELNGKPYPLPRNATRVVRDLRIDRRAIGETPDAARP
ncbi:MAG: helix-turn-helix domain-containing protein [Thermoanaerobaculia bacterium]